MVHVLYHHTYSRPAKLYLVAPHLLELNKFPPGSGFYCIHKINVPIVNDTVDKTFILIPVY